MLKTLLGDDGFRKGMDLYFERHDGTGGDGRGFRRGMADANGHAISASSCCGIRRPARPS